MDTSIYECVIGKLNFLSKNTRPDIEYAVHQYARFCDDPRRSCGDTIVHLAKYLKGTRDKGLIFDPKNLSRSMPMQTLQGIGLHQLHQLICQQPSLDL
eukprot:827123-Ditylum_brightwellii.AAC.1